MLPAVRGVSARLEIEPMPCWESVIEIDWLALLMNFLYKQCMQEIIAKFMVSMTAGGSGTTGMSFDVESNLNQCGDTGTKLLREATVTSMIFIFILEQWLIFAYFYPKERVMDWNYKYSRGKN